MEPFCWKGQRQEQTGSIISLGFLWRWWCGLMKSHNKEEKWQLTFSHARGWTPAVNVEEQRLLCIWTWSLWDLRSRAQGDSAFWDALSFSHSKHWDQWWAPRFALVYLINRLCTVWGLLIHSTSICLVDIVVWCFLNNQLLVLVIPFCFGLSANFISIQFVLGFYLSLLLNVKHIGHQQLSMKNNHYCYGFLHPCNFSLNITCYNLNFNHFIHICVLVLYFNTFFFNNSKFLKE